MTSFIPEKLHVDNDPALTSQKQLIPRKYTLTHSDVTGDLFLTIAPTYDRKKLTNFYTRLMRDEVLGEWKMGNPPTLHIHCHVSGGVVFGPAKWRDSMFKQHLPMVLEAICSGDRQFLFEHSEYLTSPIMVHFHARQRKLDRVEHQGIVKDYFKPNQSTKINT